MRACMLVAGAWLVSSGCEKPAAVSSGKLSAEEASLMSRLPSKVGLAFGGNLPGLQQQLARSPLMRLAKLARFDHELVEAGKAWQGCLAEKKLAQMMGTVDARNGFELAFLITGLAIGDLEGCAKHASLAYELDADKKFIAIDLAGPGFKTRLPHLVLSDGAIYGKYSANLTLDGAGFKAASRAQMEAEIAATKQANATQNDRLLATIAKADRKAGMWFAGSAEATPIGDKVHEVYGSLDLAGGLAVDATVELTDRKLAGQIIVAIDQARESARLLGRELQQVLDALSVTRDGDRIRVTLKVSDAQLNDVFERFGSMIGGMGSRRRDPQEREP